MTFEQLRNNPEYEIMTEYPHIIRKIANKKIVMEYVENNGYTRLNLSEKVNGRNVQHKYYKHRLIAIQFIENPNDFDYVDHINRNRHDNRIENLRWCSASENNKNRISSGGIENEHFDHKNENAIVVND